MPVTLACDAGIGQRFVYVAVVWETADSCAVDRILCTESLAVRFGLLLSDEPAPYGTSALVADSPIESELRRMYLQLVTF